ncbi:MAG: TniQ family protein [Candidatus Thiodiazotropha sp. (ex Lucinoma borealis)]|nr:TniQ family protein [Candidatus Thiodiazotropha sp. (ex Lucinoma borealis)]
MTHGKVWPAHPKPLQDELLSSWIVRIAQANVIKLQTLSRMLFGENLSPWMRDIDRTPPPWLLNTFCRYTGTNRQTVGRATLETYKNRLFANNRVSGHQQWILTLSQAGTNRYAYGQQYCPVCLAEDSVPYFRKQWRIAVFTYCPIHQVELHDACPECKKPVVYYRVDFGRDIKDALPIYACHACGYDLRESELRSVYFPSGELQRIFNKLSVSLIDAKQGGKRFDLGFFDVLHQICRVMGTRQNHGMLLKYVSDRMLWVKKISIPTGWITIEERRREERHVWMMCALWLVVDLKNRLYQAWLDKAVRYNLLVKDFEGAPIWFREEVKRMSDPRKR